MISLFLRSSFGFLAIALVLAGAALVQGCAGGSGSSGFGIAESIVLQRVADRQSCEIFDGILYCPADATGEATPTEIPTATASPTAEAAETQTPATPELTQTPAPTQGTTPMPQFTPTIEPTTVPSPTGPLDAGIHTNAPRQLDNLFCTPVEFGQSCAVDFQFSASGFDDDEAFRVAVRLADTDEPWLVLEPVAATDSAFVYSVRIPFDPTRPLAPEERIQLVVLVFERDPGPVPEHVARLSDTGADQAFVVTPIPVLFL